MTEQLIKRSRKRIIKRDQLPISELATTKKPPAKPTPKRKPAPKVPTTPPSEIRLKALNSSLNVYQTWIEKYPLALGIEKQLFQHIAKHGLSASKRVVKKLLSRHAHERRYLQAVQAGEYRYNLDGSKAGMITDIEREYARETSKKKA